MLWMADAVRRILQIALLADNNNNVANLLSG